MTTSRGAGDSFVLIVCAVREFPQRIVNKTETISMVGFIMAGLNLSGKSKKT
jgi:hypothetical protein